PGVFAVVAFSSEDQDQIAGPRHLERVLRDAFADAANHFSLRLARCPRVLFPLPHLSNADYWNRHEKTLHNFLTRKRRFASENGFMEKEYKQLAELLREGERILVFTGAGISTGSGIPDFRGPDGVWKRRQPVYYHDFMRSEAARIEHWDFKSEGWAGFRDARPNATHHSIVQLERAGKLIAVVTQNIDGLHERAGTSPELLVELHGKKCFVECHSCGQLSDPEQHFEYFRKTRRPPVCECGGFLKPATISFGQNLRNEDLERASQFADKADL